MSAHTRVIAILTTRKNSTRLLEPKKKVKLWVVALKKAWRMWMMTKDPITIRPSGRQSLHYCCISRREVAEAREEDRRLINRFEGVEPLESWYVLLVFPIRLYYV